MTTNIEWGKKRPSALIEEINNILSKSGDNGVSIKGDYKYALDTIFDHLKINTNIPTKILFDYFDKATFEIIRSGKKINESNIITHFSKAINELENNQKNFIVLTKIDSPEYIKLKSKRINNTKLFFYRSIPKKYQKPRALILEKFKYLKHLKDNGNIFVVCHCKAVNQEHALFLTKEAIDLIRSSIQICFRPIPNILAANDAEEYPLGSMVKSSDVHTVHSTESTLIEPQLWYEVDPVQNRKFKIRKPDEVDEKISYILKKLNTHPLRNHLIRSLIQYIKATDSIEFEQMFFSLSRTLEILLNTDQSEDLINGVITICAIDQAKNREIIFALRDIRNRVTHAGISPNNISLKNSKLSFYISNIIILLLNNKKIFSNLEDIKNITKTKLNHETILKAKDDSLTKLKSMIKAEKYLEKHKEYNS